MEPLESRIEATRHGKIQTLLILRVCMKKKYILRINKFDYEKNWKLVILFIHNWRMGERKKFVFFFDIATYVEICRSALVLPRFHASIVRLRNQSQKQAKKCKYFRQVGAIPMAPTWFLTLRLLSVDIRHSWDKRQRPN